jgi:phosphatidylserine/phosphatidylglycerophosphate/cardiolipin synthase-like enzyme
MMQRILLLTLAVLGYSLLVLGAGIGIGTQYRAPDERAIPRCFVPQQNCEQFVVEAIKRLGTKRILVQAYGFTSPPILQALADAKTADKTREVRVILDDSNEQERYTGATFMINHGVPVLIDHEPAIAHSKIMIFDECHVLTGSFNFTTSAQRRNTENVILVENDCEVGKDYIANWKTRESLSRPYAGPKPPKSK